MTSIKSITLALVVAATSMTALAPMADAAGLPNLKPGFNTKTGKLTVKNTGLAKSGKFVATISCSASGGGSCPDPTPAQMVPYTIPGYDDVAAIAFKPIAGGNSASKVIGLVKTLNWAPGQYTLTVCVDAGQQVKESNEGDNCRRFRKSVRPGSLTPPLRLNPNRFKLPKS